MKSKQTAGRAKGVNAAAWFYSSAGFGSSLGYASVEVISANAHTHPADMYSAACPACRKEGGK